MEIALSRRANITFYAYRMDSVTVDERTRQVIAQQVTTHWHTKLEAICDAYDNSSLWYTDDYQIISTMGYRMWNLRSLARELMHALAIAIPPNLDTIKQILSRAREMYQVYADLRGFYLRKVEYEHNLMDFNTLDVYAYVEDEQ